MSINAAWALPPLLEAEVVVAAESGLYESEGAFIADAIRTLLAARPDVRVTIACRLYAQGIISLGKAAELSGLELEALKVALHERSISRIAPEDAAETKAMVAGALKILRS